MRHVLVAGGGIALPRHRAASSPMRSVSDAVISHHLTCIPILSYEIVAPDVATDKDTRSYCAPHAARDDSPDRGAIPRIRIQVSTVYA